MTYQIIFGPNATRSGKSCRDKVRDKKERPVWLPGQIKQVRGPVLSDDRLLKRHTDHIRMITTTELSNDLPENSPDDSLPTPIFTGMPDNSQSLLADVPLCHSTRNRHPPDRYRPEYFSRNSNLIGEECNN